MKNQQLDAVTINRLKLLVSSLKSTKAEWERGEAALNMTEDLKDALDYNVISLPLECYAVRAANFYKEGFIPAEYLEADFDMVFQSLDEAKEYIDCLMNDFGEETDPGYGCVLEKIKIWPNRKIDVLKQCIAAWKSTGACVEKIPTTSRNQ